MNGRRSLGIQAIARVYAMGSDNISGGDERISWLLDLYRRIRLD
jgi:hypothetical protein